MTMELSQKLTVVRRGPRASARPLVTRPLIADG